MMGKQKRLHKQAVIDGKESPYRGPSDSKEPGETAKAKVSLSELKEKLKNIR